MEALKLCYLLLLLPVAVCFKDAEVTLVKMIQKEPDFTPLCTNSTQEPIIMIVCRIRTERSRGDNCSLLYRHEQGFTQECDSRFKLMTKNQTVFLHLSSLKPSDSGNHTCECSTMNGTFIYHLNVTVADPNENGQTFDHTWIIVVVLFIITSVILVFIHQRQRKQPELHCSHLDGGTEPTTEPQDIEPYSTFIRKENGLYSIVKLK